MIISTNWLKEYVDFADHDVTSLIKRFTLSTAEVEEIFYKGSEVSGVIVAQIKTVEPHPNSKKLHLLTVDTGSKICNVVCGAPNVEVGQRVAFAPEGASVVGMKITKAKVAGVDSEKVCVVVKMSWVLVMIIHGLMTIDVDCPLGTDIKTIYDIDDNIFEVDNKSLTNRPDLWGIMELPVNLRLAGTKLKSLPLTEPKYTGSEKIN